MRQIAPWLDVVCRDDPLGSNERDSVSLSGSQVACAYQKRFDGVALLEQCLALFEMPDKAASPLELDPYALTS